MKAMSRWRFLSNRRFQCQRAQPNAVELLEPRCLLTHYGSPVVPAYSSLPGANHAIYLDFNGHVTENTSWNDYFANPSIDSPPYDINANPASFSSTELANIEEVWKRVSEDYIPFNVNVTTVDPGIEALRKSGGADTQWGIRVVITADTENSGAGGIAYIDSFNWSSDTPVWVYNTGAKAVAEAASHEVGHSLGLSHDGTSTTGYYTGHGSGDTSWAPIMGVGYYTNVTTWDKGEYYGSNNAISSANYSKGPDDLAIITTYNGFGYKSDDYGNTNASSSPLSTSGASVSGSGIIERTSDIDVFTLTTDAGNVTLNITPFMPGPNLDIKANLYDSAGNFIATSNPSTLLTASFSLALAAGQYYLAIDGTGVGTPTANPPSGYTEYASLGRYTITGTIVDPGQLPQLSINDVSVNETAGTATFTISITGTVNAPVTVKFATANNSASAGSDYALATGTMKFYPGDPTTKVMVVTIVDDTSSESTESFFVNLGSVVGGTITDGLGVGTIVDNDVAPTISIVAANASMNEGTGTSATPFTFTVSRTGSGTASVQYAVTGIGGNSTAAKASDFSGSVFLNGTVSFASGEASKSLTILVKADSTRESNEKFRVKLSNPTGAALSTSTADGTILNDDGSRWGGTQAGFQPRPSELRPTIADADPGEFSAESAHQHDQVDGFEAEHVGGVSFESQQTERPSMILDTSRGLTHLQRLREQRLVESSAVSSDKLIELPGRIGVAKTNGRDTEISKDRTPLCSDRSTDNDGESPDDVFARVQDWLEV